MAATFLILSGIVGLEFYLFAQANQLSIDRFVPLLFLSSSTRTEQSAGFYREKLLHLPFFLRLSSFSHGLLRQHDSSD